MNEGQSPINIFQIGNQGTTPQQSFGVLNQQATNQTMGIIQQGQQDEMDRLDEELRQQGLLINKMADDAKRKYVNSLTDTQYQRMLQYKNAGYSFEASKALVDLERQQNVTGGGYRGAGFQIGQPVGGANSVWNRLNPVGRITEFLDDQIQKIPDIDVKGNLSKKLTQRINNLTEEERKAYEDQFNNLSDKRKKRYGNVDTYIEEQNKSFIDILFGADTDPSHTGPNLGQMIANSPVSALKTLSATVRGVTNPLDTIVMLKDLIATPEGREVIKYRYGSWEGFQEALEKDVIGVASDVLAVAEAGGTAAGLATKTAAVGTRMLGATNTAAKLSKTGGKILNAANTAGLASDLGVELPHNAILNKTLGKLAEGGKISNLAGNYLSLTQRPLRTIWAGANPNGGTAGNFVFPGIEKKVTNVLDGIKERVQTSATGLTPEVKERIRQNPYIKEYWDRIEQMINDEGVPMDNQRIMEGPIQEVGEELIRRLEEYESRLQETGPEYATIRAMQRPYNFSEFLNGVYRVFDENGISIGADDELIFSRTANPADMNPIKAAWNIIRNVYPQLANLTPKQLLDLRMQLRSLINYESDTRATRYSKKVLQGIVDGELNKIAHKEIPGLEKIDNLYHTQLNELKQFKDGLVYQIGEKKGQIKDNFFSIIKTLGTQNRQKMKARLEQLYPEIGARVEAINMLPKLAKAYQDSPAMMKALFKTAGIMGGLKYGGGPIKTALSWVLGIVADELLAKPLGEKWRKMAIDELLNETSPEAQQALAEIYSKVQAGVELSEAEKQTLATAIQEIALSEKQYLDERALEERQANEEYTPYFNDKDYKYRVANENILEQGNTNPYGFDKMTGEMTPERKQRGLDVYGLANEDINNPSLTQAQKENIDIARKTFIILNQQVGYTEKLGLNQGEVNARIEEWTHYSEGVKDLVDSIHNGADQKNRWMGIDNLSAKLEQVINSDALKTLVRKIEGTTPNSADERAIVETIMAINGHNDYRLLAIEFLAFEDTRLRKTESGEVRGYYNRKEDKMYVREDMPYTIEHEIGHFIDYLWGRELFGKDVYASDLGASYDGVDGRVKKFHQEFESFVDDLVDGISEEKKNDMGVYRVNEDGSVEYLKDYRTRRDEVFARFVNAFVEWTKSVANGGMTEKNNFGLSAEKDEFTLEQFMRFAELIQGKTKLFNNGLLKTAETPKGGKRIDIDKISENYAKRERTPEEKETYAGSMLQDVGEILRGFDMEAMLTSYNKDLMKWGNAVEKKLGNSYGQKDFIDFYLTLKSLQGDADFMEGLRLRAERIKKAQANGTAYGKENVTRLYDLLSGDMKLEKNKLPINVRNQELMEPLRRWIIQHGITRQWELDRFKDNYSPDTIYWKQQMNGNFKKTTLDEFKELEKYAQAIANTEDIDWNTPFEKYSNVQVAGMSVDKLIDTIGNGIGETFVEKRVKQVANDMWDDVMEPLGDIFRNAIDQDKGDYGKLESYQKPDAFNEFSGLIFYELGETYSEDIAKRGREINQKIHDIASRHGIVLKKKTIIPEQKLQGLGAKLKEILAIKGLPQIWENQRELHFKPLVNERLNDLIGQAFQRVEVGEAEATTKATQQLVALSNMDVDKFKAQMEKFGGKSPMPSIAVTDVNVPHTAFGDLTLVFGKDTVDPAADPRNVIYASDAWTTTFPEVKEAGGIEFSHVREEIPQMIEEIINKGADLEGEESALTEAIQNELLNIQNKRDLYANAYEYALDVVDNALDRVGLDRDNNEGAYMELEGKIEDFINKHKKEEVIPGYYFKGSVDYNNSNTRAKVIDELYDIAPEKIKNEALENKLFNVPEQFKDTPFKNTLESEIYDRIEGIEDYPNDTPSEAGRKLLDTLVKDYGFDRNQALPILEQIFGEIVPERLTESGLADKLKNYTPLNDGDMGEDFGIMSDDNLDAMNGDIEMMNRQLGRRVLEEWADQESNVDGKAYMNHIMDTMLDEWEENVRSTIDNYVTVELRERAIGDDPTVKQEKEWLKDKGEKQIGEIMDGVEASLTDMKEFVKDIINNEMLIEDVNRDRPLTPDNVLEAMLRQGGPNRTNAEGTLRDLVGVEGKKFESLEEVRGKNLAKTTHDDRTGDLSAIDTRYETVVKEIRDIFTAGDDIPEDFSTQTVRQEIKWNYDSDLETFRSNLEEENPMWEDVPDDYLKAIIECVEMGKQVPIRFSESKPERLVDLYKEVQYVLVPDGEREQVNNIVKGTPLEGKVYSYDRGSFKSARSDKMKQLQRRYGNVFFAMGGVIMPIAMLQLMAEQVEES